MSKFADHLKKHAQFYIGSGVGIVIGATALYFATSTPGGNTAIQKVLAFKTGNVTQNVIQQLSRRGHPGNIIKCLETGETFASQNRASELLHIPSSVISKHLNGLIKDAKGLHFEKIGEAVN